jgi:predicted O-methyltransferase YrrM
VIEADLSKAVDLHDYNEKLEQELKKAHGEEYTDYLDAISRYSSEIKSYREIGTWQGASTSRILLEKIPYVHTIDNDLKKYLKHHHHFDTFAKQNKIEYIVTEKDSLDYLVGTEVDFTFLDGWHNANHVFKELLKYSLFTKKYIMLHDTTLFPRLTIAVDRFVNKGGWKIKEVHRANVGFTILEKK